MAIIGGDQRNSAFARKLHQISIDARLDLEPLILHLKEKVSFAENVSKPEGVLSRPLVFLLEQRVGNFAAQACGKRKETFSVLGEQIMVDARLVVKAVQKAGGDQPDEITVSLFVLAQQHEMV